MLSSTRLPGRSASTVSASRPRRSPRKGATMSDRRTASCGRRSAGRGVWGRGAATQGARPGLPPEVPHEPPLIDEPCGWLLASAGDPLVIPALNRDGDLLPALVLPLFGSTAGSESLLVAFEEDYEPQALMAEAAHGTAPSLRGKNVANPMAMILAGAALLAYGDERSQQVGRAIREACLEAVSQGVRTADLGGHSGTSEDTDEGIRRVKSKLEVWATL